MNENEVWYKVSDSRYPHLSDPMLFKIAPDSHGARALRQAFQAELEFVLGEAANVEVWVE